LPFRSEKQRKWMWANKPEMARRWAEHDKRSTKERQKSTHKRLKDRR